LGQDAQENRYYYLQDHRLWIQRVIHSSHRPPPPPPPPKRRRGPRSKKVADDKTLATKRRSAAIVPRSTSGSTSKSPRKDRGLPKDRSQLSASKKRQRAIDDDGDFDFKSPATPSTTLNDDPSSAKRARSSRGSRLRNSANVELWEAVPEEWLTKEKKIKTRQEQEDEDAYDEDDDEDEQSAADSSILSSVGDHAEEDDEEEEEEEEQEEQGDEAGDEEGPIIHASSAVDDIGGIEGVVVVVAADGTKEDSISKSVEEEVSGKKVDLDDGLMPWEREYYAERDILEAAGFVEWEAVRIPSSWSSCAFFSLTCSVTGMHDTGGMADIRRQV
jgi:hypothetical protein